jgi:flagellar biogenesis protein FliO
VLAVMVPILGVLLLVLVLVWFVRWRRRRRQEMPAWW